MPGVNDAWKKQAPLRMSTEHLDVEGGRLMHGGSAFTGVAYEVDEHGVVTSNFEVADGMCGAPYEQWDSDIKRVCHDVLVEREQGRFYLFGKPFCGTTYRFESREPNQGRLLVEYCYSPDCGMEVRRKWYHSGQLKLEERETSRGCETEEWFENGGRSSLSTRDFRISFTEDGKLFLLHLARGYPADEFAPPYDIGDRLHLSGDAVDDGLLESLGNLRGVQHLSLRSTKVSSEGLQAFSICDGLARLQTDRNQSLRSTDIRDLLKKWPECDWIDMDGAMAKQNRPS